MSHYAIRRMAPSEVQIAIDWAEKEGWNPGLNDAAAFYKTDPNGFFLGTLDDKPIAVGAAVIYSDSFAFCGLYIVTPEFRKLGYGMRLTEERLKYVGARITGIDGVLENVIKYQKLGYQPAYKQSRYEWTQGSSGSISSYIVDLKRVPFNILERFDRHFFPAPRAQFLRFWIDQPQSHAVGYVKDQQLRGYAVIRKCVQGYKIGPLFALSPEIAHLLFEALCSKVGEGPIYLDIPEPNKNAHMLVKSYDMNLTFEVMRMYRNGFPSLDVEGIYGVTTFELG